MPELPDVEIFRRYFERTALRQKIETVELGGPGRMMKGVAQDMLRNRLRGGSFRGTRRHGKYMFAALDGDGWLLLHFGMTGYLDYDRNGAPAPGHARLIVRFANGARLAGMWRRLLGQIALVDDPDEFVRDRKLGPDAFDVDADEFREMLARRRGSIKAALMDQGLIAGLGNVYSDEMLFQAHVDPRASASALDPQAADALYRAMGYVLKTAIERDADPARVPDTWLLPHRAPGAKCPRCGGKIERISISGRHAFVCPTCQKA